MNSLVAFAAVQALHAPDVKSMAAPSGPLCDIL